MKAIKLKHLSTFWTNESVSLQCNNVVLKMPAIYDTVLLVVKKEGENPLKVGRLFGKSISDKKFAVGFRERPSGAWNLWVQVDGQEPLYFENFKECRVTEKYSVCLFAVSAGGMQHLVQADNLHGAAIVLHSCWFRADLEQPLYFASTYMKNADWDIEDLVQNTPVTFEEDSV